MNTGRYTRADGGISQFITDEQAACIIGRADALPEARRSSNYQMLLYTLAELRCRWIDNTSECATLSQSSEDKRFYIRGFCSDGADVIRILDALENGFSHLTFQVDMNNRGIREMRIVLKGVEEGRVPQDFYKVACEQGVATLP